MKTKRLIAFLLTLIIVISQVPTNVFAKSDRLPEQEHEKFDFNSLEYVHLEEEEVEEIINRINEISKLCKDSKNIDEIKNIINWKISEVDELLKKLNFITETNFLAASYDEYWVEEYDYVLEIINIIDSTYDNNLSVLCKSECKDVLIEVYGENAIEKFAEKTEVDSDVSSLREEIDELVNEYLAYYPQAEYNGKTYTESSAHEAFLDGEISYEEFSMIRDDIYKIAEEKCSDIYFNLIKKYNALANSYGYDNYLEYAYENIFFRDFTPEKAMIENENIIKILKPYYSCLNAYDASWIYEESIKILGDDLLALLGKLVEKIAPEFKESYDYMIDSNACFFVPNFSPMNSYTSMYKDFPYIYIKDQSQKIFVFLALIHEFGHYNMNYWRADVALNLDLHEIFSHGLELLASKYFNSVYGDFKETAEGYGVGKNLNLLYNYAVLLENTAFLGDYKTSRELLDAIHNISKKYYSKEDTSWFKESVLFYNPGYMYSYEFSALSALELYVLSKENYEAAIDAYMKLLANCSLPTNEAIKEAGLTTNWTKSKLKKLFNKVLSLYLEYDPPVIEGVEDGKVYTEMQMVHVTDQSRINILVTYNDDTYDLDYETFPIIGSNSPIRILATDGFGNSTEIEFIVEPTPFIIKTELNEEGKHVLSWEKYNYVTRYIVYGAPLGEKFKKLATIDGSQSTFVNSASDNRIWKYYVLELRDDWDGTTVKLASSKKSFMVSDENEKYTNVKSIEIESDEEITLKIGQSLKLPVIISSENKEKRLYHSKKNKKIKWESSNPGVITVENGKITALSEGTGYIYVSTLNGCMDRIIVHIEP